MKGCVEASSKHSLEGDLELRKVRRLCRDFPSWVVMRKTSHHNDPNIIFKITCDEEFGCYGYDPDIKQQSSE